MPDDPLGWASTIYDIFSPSINYLNILNKLLMLLCYFL